MVEMLILSQKSNFIAITYFLKYEKYMAKPLPLACFEQTQVYRSPCSICKIEI